MWWPGSPTFVRDEKVEKSFSQCVFYDALSVGELPHEALIFYKNSH